MSGKAWAAVIILAIIVFKDPKIITEIVNALVSIVNGNG